MMLVVVGCAVDDEASSSRTPSDTAATMTATVSYASSIDGQAACDMDIRWTGVGGVYPCPDCDFSFEVNADVVRDASTDLCDPLTRATLIDPDRLPVSGWLYYEADGGWGGKYCPWYPEGPSFDLRYDYPDTAGCWRDDVTELGCAGCADHPFLREGDSFSWTYSRAYSGVHADNRWWDTACAYSDATAFVIPTDTGGDLGEIACTGQTIDVWSFTTTGGELTVTARAVDDNSAAILWAGIVDDQACLANSDRPRFAYGTYLFPDNCDTLGYGCYAVNFDATPGVWTIVVAAECEAGPVSYRLAVTGAPASAPALVEDDAALYLTRPTMSLDIVSGQGTLHHKALAPELPL